MKKALLLISIFTFALTAQAHSIATDQRIDVKKFVGKWYAHGALPLFFSKGCLYQTAEYEVLSENKVSVFNTCVKSNKIKTIRGEAVVRNPGTNSQLNVHFYTWWARTFNVVGDYNIIKIDPNYEYVMVGSQNRKSLWIMSKSKQMPEEIYEEYLNYAKELNFNTNKIVKSKF